MITVDDAIAQANAILPHRSAPEGELDLRWQAIIGVSEFVESDPVPVWEFTHRWAANADEDLQTALATCLLEHLFEHHFGLVYPLVQRALQADPSIAPVVVKCWALGEATEGWHAAAFDQLKRECSAHAI
jgi:hypothetical protein